ncbi:hypothetical protein [Hirschia baltica]|uniref:Lipoprotein n=1 Tax=Hirschia baltica (strain ATCC 49814 / DSM 5838 / IFAM 1418) TaxID=582402 RepID=C6XMT0_HIRBI|nr:hypothetical protein [Hirschia baltica]ACT59994.1 hypothetical protein Hbal_2314 [Hirschia baltica ATCC 49814]
MKLHLPLLVATGLLASACASTTAPVSDTSSVSQTKELQKKEPLQLTKSSPALEDISASSKWTAVELLWPESPYMALSTSEKPDQPIYGLSFNCNTDTGAISGSLQNQPKDKTGSAASFSLRTSDGTAMTLLGMYAKNSLNNSTDFVFNTDWKAMRAISNAERVDLVNPEGQSMLALVKDEAPHRGDTHLLATSEGFEDAQTQLYYYCNPK